MSRRLLTTNAVLALLSVGFAVSIIGKMTATHESAAPARPATTVAAVVASTADRVAATPTFYSTIGSRNVFSPTRADTQKTDAAITIIGQRLKLSGMHWTVKGANAIIALRCCQMSNRWEQFWESRATG